jgi:hypothetical protein
MKIKESDLLNIIERNIVSKLTEMRGMSVAKSTEVEAITSVLNQVRIIFSRFRRFILGIKDLHFDAKTVKDSSLFSTTKSGKQYQNEQKILKIIEKFRKLKIQARLVKDADILKRNISAQQKRVPREIKNLFAHLTMYYDKISETYLGEPIVDDYIKDKLVLIKRISIDFDKKYKEYQDPKMKPKQKIKYQIYLLEQLNKIINLFGHGTDTGFVELTRSVYNKLQSMSEIYNKL